MPLSLHFGFSIGDKPDGGIPGMRTDAPPVAVGVPVATDAMQQSYSPAPITQPSPPPSSEPTSNAASPPSDAGIRKILMEIPAATRRAATDDLEGRCKADSTLTPWDKLSWAEKLDLVRSFMSEAEAEGLSAETLAERRRVERGDPPFSGGCALM